jgi:hypothetical protein
MASVPTAPMTTLRVIRVRHRTTPSFAVEIKRARTPSVGTSTRKAVSFESDTRHRPKMRPSGDLFAAAQSPSRLSLGGETASDAPRARTGRILPSLTKVVDPIQARQQQETDERTARRTLAQKTCSKAATAEESIAAVTPRKRHVSPASAGGFHVTDEPPAVGSAPQTGAVRETHIVASSPRKMPSGHAEEPRGKKRHAYWAAYRKAVRRGLPLPSLPAGERWKRRLPPVVR